MIDLLYVYLLIGYTCNDYKVSDRYSHRFLYSQLYMLATNLRLTGLRFPVPQYQIVTTVIYTMISRCLCDEYLLIISPAVRVLNSARSLLSLIFLVSKRLFATSVSSVNTAFRRSLLLLASFINFLSAYYWCIKRSVRYVPTDGLFGKCYNQYLVYLHSPYSSGINKVPYSVIKFIYSLLSIRGVHITKLICMLFADELVELIGYRSIFLISLLCLLIDRRQTSQNPCHSSALACSLSPSIHMRLTLHKATQRH